VLGGRRRTWEAEARTARLEGATPVAALPEERVGGSRGRRAASREKGSGERESQGLRGNPWISTVGSRDGRLMATEAVAGPVGGIGPSCIFFFSFDNK